MKKNYKFKFFNKKRITVFGLSLLFVLSSFIQAQNSEIEVIDLDWDVCRYYPSPNSHKSSIKVPNYIRQKVINGGGGCSTFIVNYNGFTPQAQAAFQQAVDIWSNLLESPVPIRVFANFGPLGDGVLGGAGPDGFIINVPGFPTNMAFASALGEQLIGEDSDGPSGTSNDIVATFSSTANFYFGLDANPPGGQVDFVSVVLHELGHGLGILGFGRVPTDVDGNPDPDPPVVGALRNSGFITPWDQFIENGTPAPITSFTDPSAALLSEFTGNNLFCNGPIATSQNGGVKPSTYAPSTFNGGSSYSHWDESTYFAGHPNSLMTPFIAPGEAIHNPGLVTLGFMEDMGWSICGGSLSTEELTLESIEISPNPFSSSLTIKFINGNNDDYNISIIDIKGRVILNEIKNSMDGSIVISNLDQLENAIYFLEITNKNNGASITKRVIKD
ncbi:T9SS type A sorting domain-containing protein [Winogradskyella echinorum]|uniref:T9SS type A sorting domain-containing protein n=1 Tax=Winogradskyella echinorum TaxID=538189 RepID=A0ABR6XYK1_9FLAO|nr:T9SS type A sorting domain-containing protein [Winogradskyella echinorum]MBC3845578.1 T9SS type A sorting domain-containing protein [Winogradskyella echinorum]MBC5749926.1 T9SS type A sorting domain-containing protein [Winogradskyella echinorum]